MSGTQSSLLIRNGRVVTPGANGHILEDRGNLEILVQDGKISRIAPASVFSGYHGDGDIPGNIPGNIIDARGKLVMPGLINAHTHFYSTFARGLYKVNPSKNFNEVLKNLWWKLDKALTLEGVYYSALIAMIDCIKKGTTTVFDHHSSPGAIRGSLTRIADAVGEAGLRACLCYEVSDRDGPKAAGQSIDENHDFIMECRRRAASGDGYLRGLFGLHASFTISDATLLKAVDVAAKAGAAGFHVHAAEAATDQEHSLKHFGVSIVERFRRAGVLGPQSMLAHCVHIDETQMNIIAETGTNVVHNPQSNMNNAVGVADVVGMAKKGICVGLGTDAMTANMFEEMRSAVWLQKLNRKNSSDGFIESLNALLVNNSKIAKKYWDLGVESDFDLGVLKEGAAADMILVDYEPPTPFDSASLLGHICFGVAESAIDTTIVGGRVLMRDKKLEIGIDEERIAARSRELAKEVWKAF
ncbi:MAG: putative aminohydrolase SsnA [Bdellovibrionota bacterium]